MALITLVSAKGSPGVTTTAAALVAAAHDPEVSRTGGLLVELDPAGGDIELLVGARTGESSLLAAAADVRRTVPGEVLAGHAGEVRPGLRALVAPVAGTVTGPVVEAVGARVGVEIARVAGWVFTDAGRWSRAQGSAGRVAGADVVGVVCRSTATSVAHARDLLTQLPPGRAVLVLVGDEPYGPADVAEVVDVPVLGPLSWDPRGVADLWSAGATARWLGRRPLGRSARRLLDDLSELVDGAGAPARAGVPVAATGAVPPAADPTGGGSGPAGTVARPGATGGALARPGVATRADADPRAAGASR